jgi:two-component system, NarL family, invasion response regulator UvrY
MTNLFIADDHVLLREGLKKILREELDMKVVDEARTAAEIQDRIVKSGCDILILDLSLPDKSGLDVLKDVKTRHPKMKVLILSTYPADRFAIRCLKAGADGYLCKDSAAEELVAAVRRVAGGKKYFGEEISQELAADLVRSGSHDLLHETLSDREFEIFCLLGSGKTITEIASALNLSISTVNTHRAHILDKMKMESNVQLIRYAIENKLVD